MTDHRGSYRKTVVVGALASGVAALALVWILLAASQGLRVWTPAALLATAVGALVLVPAFAWTALVCLGGLISLHRDALEAQGKPYASSRRREWTPGPVAGGARRVLGSLTRLLRPSRRLGLRPGELVEVRSLQEILESLDARGTLQGLPFMPEMAALCGQRFRVYRRVDKINDWVGKTGLRRVHDTVTLEGLRCDGEAHGGCQASCHLRWNEAWLVRAPGGGRATSGAPVSAARSTNSRSGPAGAADLQRLARRVGDDGTTRYVCQVTELGAGTTPLAWADPRHYVRDLMRGNVRLRPLLAGVAIGLFNWVQGKRGGATYPHRVPAAGSRSLSGELGLRPGEVVRVKSKREIELTLNSRSRNRGLWFDAELLRFCGGEYRVLTRVQRLIEEQTGRLISISNPSIILDGVVASGEYLGFCAQAEAIFWREIWLERVPPEEGASRAPPPRDASRA